MAWQGRRRAASAGGKSKHKATTDDLSEESPPKPHANQVIALAACHRGNSIALLPPCIYAKATSAPLTQAARNICVHWTQRGVYFHPPEGRK